MTVQSEGAYLATDPGIRGHAAARAQVLEHRLAIDYFVLAMVAVSACAIALTEGGIVRLVFVLIALCFVPGAVILGHAKLADDLADWVGLSIALSLAVETAAALVMVWTGWWHPFAFALIIGTAACAVALFDLLVHRNLVKSAPSAGIRVQRLSRRHAPAGVSRQWHQVLTFLLPAVAGLALWAVAIGHIDVRNLGDYGLPPALPATWYAALAVLVVGVLIALASRKPNGVIIGVYVGAIILVLFGTIPAVSRWPQYYWFYKQAGITQFLELHGRVNPSIDIYNRWPGFFAGSAVFSSLAGSPNPADYASWAEVFFTAVDALLVWSAVRSVARDVRVAGGATLLFVVTNWVGQQYFCPQAFGFTLSLACCVLLLKMVRLYGPTEGRGDLEPDGGRSKARPISRRTLALVAWVTRGPQSDAAPAEEPKPLHRGHVAAFLCLFAVIVASHQLTPYMLIVQVGAITAVGMLRPRWLVLVMVALAIGYLVPNLEWMRSHFHFFTGLDPFTNAQHSSLYDISPMGGKRLNGIVSRTLSFVVWGSAALGFVRLSRQGFARRALPLALLGIAPFGLFFAQSYGGEASLRVFLFSLPWCAAMIAWAISTVASSARRAVLYAAVVSTCVALFIPAFLGQAELNIIPAGEVSASEYYYAHARQNSVLMLAAPAFPTLLAANYDEFVGASFGDVPSLTSMKRFRHRQLGPDDVDAVAALIQAYSPRGYLAFSTTETQFADVLRLTPPGALAELERAVADSPRFQLLYSNEDARIYELVPTSTR